MGNPSLFTVYTKQLSIYRVCQGLRLINRDDYFWVTFYHFEASIVFWGTWNSTKNGQKMARAYIRNTADWKGFAALKKSGTPGEGGHWSVKMKGENRFCSKPNYYFSPNKINKIYFQKFLLKNSVFKNRLFRLIKH